MSSGNESKSLRRVTAVSRSRLVSWMVSKGTKAEVTAAQKQYRYVVKNPHSADHYLDAIDEAMRSRVHLLAKKT